MGQNIQLHYDFGRYLYPKVQADRPRMTMTVEQQSLDRFGDTFYFVDMSFLQQGAVSANWKFMRNLRFWQGPLSCTCAMMAAYASSMPMLPNLWAHARSRSMMPS